MIQRFNPENDDEMVECSNGVYIHVDTLRELVAEGFVGGYAFGLANPEASIHELAPAAQDWSKKTIEEE